MPTIVNERAALRPTIYKSNGPAINLSQNAFELNRLVAMLFNRNGKGFFYDPSDMGMVYQDAAGSTAVNPTGQPVGLLLDKSNGFSLGVNKATASIVQGVAIGGAGLTTYRIADKLVVGKFYKVDITISGYEGTDTLGLAGTSSDAFYIASGDLRLKSGNTKISFIARAANPIQHLATRSTNTAIFEDIQIKELAGNHAYQTTSAARPILRQAPILGSELVVNGDFETSIASWSSTLVTAVVENAKCRLTINSTGGRLTQSIPTVAGKTYQLSWEAQSIAGAPMIRVGTASGLGDLLSVNDATGTRSAFFTAGGASTTIGLTAGSGGQQAYFDNISVKEVTGYHTDQIYIEYDGVDDKLITNLPAPLTNATVLRAIPNVGTQVKYNQTLPMLYEDSINHAGLIAIDRVLTRQEQLRLMTELDKKAGATSLETLTFKAFDNNQEGFVYDPNDLSTMFQDATGTLPVKTVGQPVGLILDKSKGLVLGANQISHPNSEELPASVNMSDGVHTWTLNTVAPISGTQDSRLIVTAPSSISTRPSLSFMCSSPLVPDRLYKFSFRYKVNSGAPRVAAVYKGDGTATITPDKGVLQGSGTFDTFIRWVAGDVTRPYVYFSNEGLFDLQIDDISVREVKGNHAYQTTSASRPILRKNAATGANYLEFDGTDDSLQTNNIDFTATDKVSLFAGVRKLSDAYSALCIELGDGTSSGLNAFALFAPSASGAMKYDLRNTVTGIGANTQDIKFNAPSSAVLAGTVTPNNVNKASLRVNGEAALTTQIGRVGNFASAPLYIGRRGGTSLPFTGHIYGLIGIGKLVSDSETAGIEKELAKRVGVTLNV